MSGATCPDDAAVDAVLLREADARGEAAVREHVAACERCLARHGASFELELHAGVMVPVDAASVEVVLPGAARSARPSRPSKTLRTWRTWRAAAAAAVLLLLAGAAMVLRERRVEPASEPPLAVAPALAPPLFAVVEWELRLDASGPDGRRSVAASWSAQAPERVRWNSSWVDAGGTRLDHERLALVGEVDVAAELRERLARTARESGP